VGLFSSVTSRQADDPASPANFNAAAGVGYPGRANAPASFNAPASVESPASFKAATGVGSPAVSTDRLEKSEAFQTRDLDRGSRLAEYLLVVYPGGELEEKLLGEQKQFSDDYAVSVRNKPHITIAAFQAGEVMEETLIRWIQRICANQHSFDLTLNNYSGFPPHTLKPAAPVCPPGQTQPSGAKVADESLPVARTMFPVSREYANFSEERIPGTIYLRVQDPQAFKQLMQQLGAVDEFIRSSGCPPVNLVSRPFLSIAGGLTEQVYNKAMPDYSRRTFHDTFHVRELVLLRRTHSFDPCKTVNIFRLRAE
jgi:2'-5' RNA ligase